MKKLMWIGMMLLAASPVMAMTVTAPVGTTHQCWYFDGQTSPYGMLPSVDENPYAGDPVATINDLSGLGVSWDNGAWFGQEFKIFLDIPNQQIANPYKILTLNMKYQGDVTFSWVADAISGNHFTLIDEQLGEASGWKTLFQQWRFEPNPREEIVVIGLKAPVGAIAAIDQICIDTICVPEPMTMTLLAMGAVCVLRRKR